MQRRAIGIVEPIPWVQRQELQFGALRQVRWLVNDKTPVAHPRLDRHRVSVALDVPPNKRLHPTAADGRGQVESAMNGRCR
jgi:hypothetical protein